MNEEKVAILLLSLEEELAAKIMKNFSASEIELIGKQMSRLHSVSLEDVNTVAKEFCTMDPKQALPSTLTVETSIIPNTF